MFKEQFEKIKKLFKNENISEKKKIQNLVFFLILLVITIIAINFIWKDNNKNPPSTNMDNNVELAAAYDNILTNTTDSNSSSNSLQDNLEKILSSIKGAGAVKVLVTYSESSSVVPIYNASTNTSTTEEKDTSGGTRTIDQQGSSKDVVFTQDNGNQTPIIEKTIMPKIEGAVVLAEGANDTQIKSNIIQAVQAVTGLSMYKIQVFELDK
ncbi:MAG: hypothetical protein FWF46_03940 [Oscillospiraceae bacterium]|nr:hypothetical protein [Oscillospiraceae bacterium]